MVDTEAHLLAVDLPTFPSTLQPAAPPRPPRRRHARRRRVRWMRWVSAVVVGALFATALGVLINDQVAERGQFDRARTALGLAHHRIADVKLDLARLRHDVELLRAQVGSSSAALHQDAAQLEAAKAALVAAQADVSQQGSRIGSLHACLSGVEPALNALAVGDRSTAIAELSSVATSCAAASGA
jgi:hypothetical protein